MHRRLYFKVISTILLSMLAVGRGSGQDNSAHGFDYEPIAPDQLMRIVGELDSQDPEHRAEAEFALGQLGSSVAKLAQQKLTTMIEDPDARVRVYVNYALARVEPGKHSESCILNLMKVLQNTSNKESSDAAYVLGDLVPQSNVAAPMLKDTIENCVRVDLCEYATLSLGKMGAAAELALPALRKLEESSTGRLKTFVSDAIIQIEGRQSRE